jgi:hypothetical protein
MSEQTLTEQPANGGATMRDTTAVTPTAGADAVAAPTQGSGHGARSVKPALANQDVSCPVCGDPTTMPVSYVYALGRIEPRFPRLSVEKEFAQAIGRQENVGLTDREALREALSQRANRYLARQLCWVLTVEGLDTYILHPRDPADFDLLLESLRPAPRQTDVDAVIGVLGPIAPPDLCNGLMTRICVFDMIYSADVDSLIKSIPRPSDVGEEDFAKVAEEVFMRVQHITDNAGATDEHRAMNYLALRYPAIYANTSEMLGRDASLSSVDVRPSPLSGVRRIVDVIFSYTNRRTDVIEKYFTRVDVTEEFPFLVTKMSPYYDL